MSEVTSTQITNGSNSHYTEPSDIYCISDDRCIPIDTYVPPKKFPEPSYQHDRGRPEKGDYADERENCDPTEDYDPCIPYTGCAEAVPSIACSRSQRDWIPSEKPTRSNLNLEGANRLMPEPTTRAPWFGYESYADYGDEGWDAVADNSSVDGKADRGSAKASSASDAKDTDGPSASKGGDISTSVGDVTVQDNSTTSVNVDDVNISVPISCSLNTSDADGGASGGGTKGAGRDNKR